MAPPSTEPFQFPAQLRPLASFVRTSTIHTQPARIQMAPRATHCSLLFAIGLTIVLATYVSATTATHHKVSPHAPLSAPFKPGELCSYAWQFTFVNKCTRRVKPMIKNVDCIYTTCS